jgi:hypothetical protein
MINTWEDDQGENVDHLGTFSKREDITKPCYPLGIHFFGR